MPRLREFDEQIVLERAMLLFWAQGYETTSMRDLQAAMGISSSSLYETFGDKRSIFLAALARYCAIEQARICQMAADAPDPRSFIEMLFLSLDHVLETGAGEHGSLAFNTMVEFGTRDPDVAAQLLDHFFKIAEIIGDVLARAQADGIIPADLPPAHLAYTFLTALQGVATLKRVKPDFDYRQTILPPLLHLLQAK